MLASFSSVFAGALLCVVSIWRMVYSQRGTAFFAIREDEIAAAAMGIDTTRYKILAFIVGAFWAGVAGGLLAHFIGYIHTNSFTFLRSVEIVAMVVLGGLGSITGAMISAAILTILPEILRFGAEYRMVIYSLLLIGLMLATAVRPHGQYRISAMAFLELDDCALSFGGLTAVSGVSLALDPGELVGLIGPNGAGKTTVFNLITGIYAPERGTIRLDGRSIAGLSPTRINRRGIARTFQGIRLFPNLTAYENVLAGHSPRAGGLLGAIAATAQRRRDARAHRRRVPVAAAHARTRGAARRRRARAAVRRTAPPRDRPRAGHQPEGAAARRAGRRHDAAGEGRADGAASAGCAKSSASASCVIEHDMKLIMEICDRITVLDHGEVIACGPPDAVRCDPKVIAAYLGEEQA